MKSLSKILLPLLLMLWLNGCMSVKTQIVGQTYQPLEPQEVHVFTLKEFIEIILEKRKCEQLAYIKIKNIPRKKNSLDFASHEASKIGANYIAIGAFFKSKTKKVNYIAKPSLISWAKRFTKLPVVIIGGITNKNFRKLLLHKPDFLAISGGIWDKKPAKAIKEFL